MRTVAAGVVVVAVMAAAEAAVAVVTAVAVAAMVDRGKVAIDPVKRAPVDSPRNTRLALICDLAAPVLLFILPGRSHR